MGCDDVELEESERKVLAEALVELSTPELFGPMPQIVAEPRLIVAGSMRAQVAGKATPLTGYATIFRGAHDCPAYPWGFRDVTITN